MATYTFYPTISGTIIEVGIAFTDVTVQELVTTIRDWEDELVNMEWPKILDASGKEELGGGVLVGITTTLRDAKLKFADRGGPDWVLCNVGGGNLVATSGDVSTYVNPIEPSTFVTVTKTSSSSATLQEQEAIQFASYMNGVWIDGINGASGTEYPRGTREYPVNNFTEAVTIASNVGLNRIRVLGSGVCDGHNISNMIIQGESSIITDINISNTCVTEGTEFKDCTLHGYLSGHTHIRDCVIKDVTGMEGHIHDSFLDGVLHLGDNGSVYISNSCSAVPGGGIPIIDMGGDGIALGVRGYNGGLELINKSGAESVTLDYVAGQLKLAASVTSGDIVVRGNCRITEDLSVGANVDWQGTSIEQIIDTKKKVLGLY